MVSAVTIDVGVGSTRKFPVSCMMASGDGFVEKTLTVSNKRGRSECIFSGVRGDHGCAGR